MNDLIQERAEEQRKAGEHAAHIWPGPIGQFFKEYFRRSADWQEQGIEHADDVPQPLARHILAQPVPDKAETQEEATYRWYGVHEFAEDGSDTCGRCELPESSYVHDASGRTAP